MLRRRQVPQIRSLTSVARRPARVPLPIVVFSGGAMQQAGSQEEKETAEGAGGGVGHDDVCRRAAIGEARARQRARSSNQALAGLEQSGAGWSRWAGDRMGIDRYVCRMGEAGFFKLSKPQVVGLQLPSQHTPARARQPTERACSTGAALGSLKRLIQQRHAPQHVLNTGKAFLRAQSASLALSSSPQALSSHPPRSL